MADNKKIDYDKFGWTDGDVVIEEEKDDVAKAVSDRAGPSTARLAVEDEVERAIETAFDDLYAEMKRRLGLNPTEE